MNTESFEERLGLPKKTLQLDYIDVRTRTRLWNELSRVYWSVFIKDDLAEVSPGTIPGIYMNYLWSDVLGLNYGKISHNGRSFKYDTEKYLLNDQLSWVDFLKFIEKSLTGMLDILKRLKSSTSSDLVHERYRSAVNKVFEEESCGYRFVGNYIMNIIDKAEIQEIEDALNNTDSINSVRNHLKSALILLSDRQNAQYNNSIKESISALEALARLITNEPNTTLSKALNKVEEKIKIHPALKESIAKLYAWAGDAPGIRHAEKGGPTETFDRAKFTLVICSGIVNYLIAKCEEESINLYNS